MERVPCKLPIPVRERMGDLPFISKETYNPHTFEYVPSSLLEPSNDGEIKPSLEDWMKIFYNSIDYFASIAKQDEQVQQPEEKAEMFSKLYRERLDALMEKDYKDAKSQLNCLTLCKMREDCLCEAGFTDIFVNIKQKENTDSIRLIPSICKELDHISKTGALRKLWETLVRNMCAANIFDLGSAHTAQMYHENDFCFESSRNMLLPRPWAIDHVDAFCDRMMSHVYNKAMIFVDNSGADVMLGMLPFARELLNQNVAKSVVIAANSSPSINDITFNELMDLLPNICEADGVLRDHIESGTLKIIPSGSGLPVIDLASDVISDEVHKEAQDTDLLVLEGMGRSIETNLFADLRIDNLRIGMVKHKEVASCLNCQLMDCVVKFCII